MDRDLGAEANVLFIGGGGYTLPTRLLASRPMARAIAVEIDPLVTEVAKLFSNGLVQLLAPLLQLIVQPD